MSEILWKSMVEKYKSFPLGFFESLVVKGKNDVDKSFQQGCGKLIGKLILK